jgi:hypothetical protein
MEKKNVAQDYVELSMPHDIFTEFSNLVRDGVPTLVVFKDALTGDIYTPEGAVTMTYSFGIKDELVS